MSRVVFKKAESLEFLKDHLGYWYPATGGNKNQAKISCPKCGEILWLYKWEYSGNGDVSPSVHHIDGPRGPCGFHEFITLEGWEA